MNNLKNLESKSIFILREAKSRFKNPAILWSIGKDSTTLLWLCRKAFYGKVPFKVLHIDTGYKFKEIYDFRDKYAKEWGLDLAISKNKDADKFGITPEKGRFACCNARKTEALKKAVKEYGFDSLLVGIRRDEHGIRGKERYFSPRARDGEWKISKQKELSNIHENDSDIMSLQDAELSGWNIFATDFGYDIDHVRVHPLLHWTEQDIWEYIKLENLPFTSLYISDNGKRYRSIGCEPCCIQVASDAKNVTEIVDELNLNKAGEREGRAQDKENDHNMQMLRSLGYM